MSLEIKGISQSGDQQIVKKLTAIVASGFEAKFTWRLFTEKEVKHVIAAFCEYLYTEKDENLLIAESRGEVCGCLFLTGKDEAYKEFYSALRVTLSISQSLKLILCLSLLSHQAQQAEKYIDFICVAPTFRGQGIAQALLSYCKNKYRQERLTLFVAQDNHAAYNLYRSLNFKIINKQTSLLMAVITGRKGWYLMEWAK